MCSLANSEDPDEMLHDTAFHQGLHCSLRQDGYSEKEMQIYLEIVTCELEIYTGDHLKFYCIRPKSESISTIHFKH